MCAIFQGQLSVCEKSGICELTPAVSASLARRGGTLASKHLSRAECMSLRSQTLLEIEFEEYVVTVEYPNNQVNGFPSSEAKQQRPAIPRVKKFKPPSQIHDAVPPPRWPECTSDPPASSFIASNNTAPSSNYSTALGQRISNAAYYVNNEELDDIWNSASIQAANPTQSFDTVEDKNQVYSSTIYDLKEQSVAPREKPNNLFQNVFGSSAVTKGTGKQGSDMWPVENHHEQQLSIDTDTSDFIRTSHYDEDIHDSDSCDDIPLSDIPLHVEHHATIPIVQKFDCEIPRNSSLEEEW